MTIEPDKTAAPAAVPATTLDTSPADEARRTPKRVMVALTIANFGLWLAFFSPVLSTLPLRLAKLVPNEHDQVIALSALVLVGGVIGIIATPIAGRLSDRTTWRIGMRRPWLIAAGVVGLAGVVLETTSPNYVGLVFGAALAQGAFGAGVSLLFALIPDHVPVKRRGVAGALLGLSQSAGIVIGVVIGGMLSKQSISAALLVPGVIGLVTILLLVLILPDRRLAKIDVPHFDLRKFFGSYWVSPRKFPDFGWAWISRFAIFLGFGSVITYQVFFLHSQLKVPLSGTAALVSAGAGLETLMLLIFSFIAGPLSDRLKRRKPFVMVAAAMGVVGMLVLATATVVPGFFIGILIIGAAQGIYYSVDIALVTQVLPDVEKDAGKDLGVFTIANQLPQVLAVVVAPVFLAVGFGSVVGAPSGQNYTALFVASALFCVVSAFAVTRVRGIR